MDAARTLNLGSGCIIDRMPAAAEDPIYVIKNYIEHVLPGFSVARLGDSTAIEVRRGAKQVVVLSYGPDQLRANEEALNNVSLPARYKNGVIRDITLRAVVAVGKEGAAPYIAQDLKACCG